MQIVVDDMTGQEAQEGEWKRVPHPKQDVAQIVAGLGNHCVIRVTYQVLYGMGVMTCRVIIASLDIHELKKKLCRLFLVI